MANTITYLGTMSQHYSDPSRESDKWALPDVEVFRVSRGELKDEDGKPLPAGWYYQTCFPGCLPDSDPIGPFKTEKLAIADMRENYSD